MGRLPDFEGFEVDRSTIKVTRAGDGLSPSLKVEPRALHQGEDVTLVLRCHVHKVIHEPGRDEDGPLVRVHVLATDEAFLADPGEVHALVSRERSRIKRLEDEAAAREPLPGIDDEPAANGAGGEPNIFGGSFDERDPIDDGQADGDLVHGHTGLPFKPDEQKPARRPRKGSLAAGLELVASLTDPSELFALMDEEERGKNRKAVMDAAAARIAELAAEQETAEVRDLVAEAEAGDPSDYGAH